MKKIMTIVMNLFLSQILMAQSQENSVVTKTPETSKAWTGLIKSELSNNLEKAKTVGGALTDNQLRLAYQITEKVNLGLLFGSKYNFASDNEKRSDQAFKNSDMAIAGLLETSSFIGSDKTEIDAQLYLPTTEESKSKNKNYTLRTDVKLPYSFESEKVATFKISPRFSNYREADEQLEVYTQLRFGKGKKFIPYAALNHHLKMSGPTHNLNRKEEYLGPEIGFEMNPHKMIKLAILVSQERNIFNPSDKKVSSSYKLFNEKETKYLLGAQIKM